MTNWLQEQERIKRLEEEIRQLKAELAKAQQIRLLNTPLRTHWR